MNEEKNTLMDGDVEKSAIGSLLMHNTSDEARAEHQLASEMFYYPAHRTIVQCIFEHSDAHEGYVDAVLIAGMLKAAGVWEDIGGMEYLMDCTDSVPISGQHPHYFQRVRELYLKRQIVATADQVIEDAKNTSEGEDFVMGVPQRFYDLIPKEQDDVRVEDVQTDLIETFQKLKDGEIQTIGLSTGISELDEITGGLEGGNYYVIAARPSAGKTTLAGQIDQHLLLQGHHTAWVNMDMPKANLYARNLCRLGQVSLAKMRSGYMTRRDREKLEMARDQWKNFNCHYLHAQTDVAKICAWVRLMKMKYDIKLLTIDFISKCTAPQVNSHEARRVIAYASATIKELCQRENIPVLILAQLRRADKKDRRPPTMDELKECGNLEEDAQAALLLYKEEKFPYHLARDASGNFLDEAKDRALWMDVAKQQNGGVGRHEYMMRAAYFYMEPAGEWWGFPHLFEND